MQEIPPTKPTDAEDVAWGLQTADTLWRRGERIDALVWLRRAAQAAGDANDDDRALELARYAAELTEWMASQDPGVRSLLPDPPVAPVAVNVRGTVPDLAPAMGADDEARPSTNSVPPAEKVHAGMFDPWADNAPRPPPRQGSVPSFVPEEDDEVITSVRPQSLAAARSEPPRVVTVPPAPLPSRPPVNKKPPPVPPPLPPRARPPLPKPPPPSPEISVDVEILPSLVPDEPVEPTTVEAKAPTVEPSAVLEPSGIEMVEPSTVLEPSGIEMVEPSAVLEPSGIEMVEPSVATHAPEGVDLEGVEAFADLPDDARVAFAAAAEVHRLGESEEVGAFALAYVVSGAADVAATVVDAPAVRLGEGAVLRARGTTNEGVPMRLIAAKAPCVVATWSDAAVAAAFGTCPWVEDDLRAAADRVQTLVGITIGPLGERLDVSIREDIVGRLTMRPLAPGEVVVSAGQPVPGLLLVGVGEIELVANDTVSGVVGSGDFLFATEVLGAGSAPATARAGAGGALVLFGDRRIAQELLVTWPPLLEVFAGM